MGNKICPKLKLVLLFLKFITMIAADVIFSKPSHRVISPYGKLLRTKKVDFLIFDYLSELIEMIGAFILGI